MRSRAALILMTALLCLAEALLSSAQKLSASWLYTQCDRYEAMAWMDGGERFPAGASIYRHDSSGNRPLVPNFTATADPNVSFDGSSVIFAGKRLPTSPWQIWEIGLAPGSQLRRIITSTDDLVRPMYLPGDRVVYARKLNGRYVIESASLDGSDTQHLSPSTATVFPSDVLLDGRILFVSGYPLAESATPELYTIYSDGSGIQSYRCDHSGPRRFGKQISSGDIIFGNKNGLGRFISASAKEEAVKLPSGDYSGGLAETASGRWIVSWRASGRGRYELRAANPSAQGLSTLLTSPRKHLVQPVAIEPRQVPKKHPSALHNWQIANLLTLSAYTSKDQPISEHMQSVRLLSKNDAGEVVQLGTAPVEKDGSLYVSVPGDKLIQFELLDANGKTIRKESGWFWTAKGEQRVCVGCHAGPERSPDNEVPAIVIRSTRPTVLGSPSASTQSGGH